MTAFLKMLCAAVATALLPCAASAQATPPLSTCAEQPDVPACDAVPGDRAEGWSAQGRSEVIAQHGMVTTSQPLAAQAGLRILMQGGNAIDAAVATAAALNVTEPMNVGFGGDLFAIVYIAKDNKLYVLNASGKAPSGATLGSLEIAWLPGGSAQLGPRLRDAACRHLVGNGAGLRLGVGRGAHALRQAQLQGGAAAGDRLCRQRLSGLATHRATNGGCRGRFRFGGMLPAARSGFRRDVVHRRDSRQCRPDLSQSRSRQDLPAPPEARDATRSTRARSRVRSWRNPPRSAAR